MKAIEKAKEVQKADRRRYDRKNTKIRIDNVIVDNLMKAISKKHPEPEKIQRKVHIEQAILWYTHYIETSENWYKENFKCEKQDNKSDKNLIL